MITPTTMAPDARRALAVQPLQYPLSADATKLRVIIAFMCKALRPTGAQRFVDLVDVRFRAGTGLYPMTHARVDRALLELAGGYLVWLSTDYASTADQDRASITWRGNSCHRVTTDDWRLAAQDPPRLSCS